MEKILLLKILLLGMRYAFGPYFASNAIGTNLAIHTINQGSRIARVNITSNNITFNESETPINYS